MNHIPNLHDLRRLRHDIRDQVQALSMGIEMLEDALERRDLCMAQRTLDQMSAAIRDLGRQEFICGEWHAQSRHA